MRIVIECAKGYILKGNKCEKIITKCPPGMFRPPAKACKPYTKAECKIWFSKKLKKNAQHRWRYAIYLHNAKASKNESDMAKTTAILKKNQAMKDELDDGFKKCADHKCP